VLTVTPQITEDGQIVMKVHPKVSSGDINPTTTLPEEETTEVDTSIMVPDGCGVIIGGLIQETDNDRQSKVPYLGDVWGLGWLFQRTVIERERSEVIVALLPRIVPNGGGSTPDEEFELERVGNPLLTPTLESAPRPEPRLRDAIRDPYLRPKRFDP
jgi:type II secretory pathway component GspD/PulD (secretin)